MCSTCGCEHPHDHVPVRRFISLQHDVLAKNQAFADANRRRFAQQGIAAVNLIASPGAGKTTLLVATIRRLAARRPIAVVEGDQFTSLDTERIAAAGAPARQINTGKGCHLDAEAVGRAVAELAIARGGLALIENVGNLVCPAEFDLGETRRVVVLSVGEGDDKPRKYAPAFASADLVVIAKLDLLPHVDFALERVRGDLAELNPRADVLALSARTGDGIDAWCAWLAAL
jgi:hydrogenase nickel incorporation protein HypB